MNTTILIALLIASYWAWTSFFKEAKTGDISSMLYFILSILMSAALILQAVKMI